MLTALAATLLTIATASPAAPVAAVNTGTVAQTSSGTLAAIMPPPGAWALMGLGGLALIRSRHTAR